MKNPQSFLHDKRLQYDSRTDLSIPFVHARMNSAEKNDPDVLSHKDTSIEFILILSQFFNTRNNILP